MSWRRHLTECRSGRSSRRRCPNTSPTQYGTHTRATRQRRWSEALGRQGELMDTTDVDLKIWRGDPAGGELVSYRVPALEGMVVLDAVLWGLANLAPYLAVRCNCKAAKCGSCSAEIQGFPRLMCKSPIAEYRSQLTVRPMKAFPIIKDLVTDVSWNYEVRS